MPVRLTAALDPDGLNIPDKPSTAHAGGWPTHRARARNRRRSLIENARRRRREAT